jgi:lipopolysaccharide/colanic/teichoic acid biosynthesis glycosyltransferase
MLHEIMGVIYYLFCILIFFAASPLLVIVSFTLWVTQGFPIVFHQKRVGLGGRIFTIYKFRTMRVGAEHEQKTYRRLNEANGPVFKIHNDPRFTRVGKFLAHTGLDELPQLFNVLQGNMALIGPRPLPVAEAGKLKKWQQARNAIKPGIISPWIVEGYHSQAFDTWMKSDVAYIKKKSFSYDLTIVGRTVALLIQLFLKEIFPS